jgi:hypothetical protein
MKSLLTGVMLVLVVAVMSGSAQAQQCFVQSNRGFVQPVVQPVFVNRSFVQPVAINRGPVFVRRPTFVRQPVFVRRRPVFVRQPVFVRRGFGVSPVRNLSLIGVFGRDAQRFSAVATGLGF